MLLSSTFSSWCFIDFYFKHLSKCIQYSVDILTFPSPGKRIVTHHQKCCDRFRDLRAYTKLPTYTTYTTYSTVRFRARSSRNRFVLFPSRFDWDLIGFSIKWHILLVTECMYRSNLGARRSATVQCTVLLILKEFMPWTDSVVPLDSGEVRMRGSCSESTSKQ